MPWCTCRLRSACSCGRARAIDKCLAARSTTAAVQVKAENPGIGFGEVGKVLGAKWKETDADARAEFEEKAAADKQRYNAEMLAFKAKQGGEADD